ncbi:MAG: hypothetical protein K0R02_208 [Rickettsiaceae bacterium]|jgi:antitoxin StbD|nr:hypothetical protein [Rickettsiaceae bacterium]
MLHQILSNYTASITDLKKEPMKVVMAAKGSPIAILNRNEPVFYCVPAELYEKMIAKNNSTTTESFVEALMSIPKIEFELPDRSKYKSKNIDL